MKVIIGDGGVVGAIAAVFKELYPWNVRAFAKYLKRRVMPLG